MLIDNTQRKWAWISLGIFVAATVSYVIYARSATNGPHGGSVMGLLYGIIGTAYVARWLAQKSAPATRTALAYFDAIPRSWKLSATDPESQPIVDMAAGRLRALDAYAARNV